jgi:hypothetical protein
MTEQFANNPSSTLNGNIDNITNSIVVVSGTPFSSTGTYRIIINTEIMLVLSRSGNTLSVVRGQEGTTVASHLSGAVVAQILTAGAMQQFRIDNGQLGLGTNLPAAGNAGKLYNTSDGNITYFDNGTLWLPTGPVMRMTQPPLASKFTVIQTGTNGTLLDDGGGLFFSALQRVASGEDHMFAAQNNPASTGAPFTLTVGFIHLPGGKNGAGGYFNTHITGIGLYNSSSTQLRTLCVLTGGTGAFTFQLRGATGLTGTATATININGEPFIAGPMTWFRIKDDGVNRVWSISNDGRHFTSATNEVSTTGFSSAPDKIGLYLSPSAADAAMTILSYSLTSP